MIFRLKPEATRRAHAHCSGPRHAAHGHGGHGHDPHEAPWSMALPLILLAVGSIFAGYVGVPHALGGSNRIETFLEPSFEAHATAPQAAAAAAEAPRQTAAQPKHTPRRRRTPTPAPS